MSDCFDINTFSVEQLTTMLEARKQQEAEEAHRRAAEALQRSKEEAKRLAEEAGRRRAAEILEKNRAEAGEHRKEEGEKTKKTWVQSSVRQCVACSKADAACTFSATNSKITSCDRCRSRKAACTFPGDSKRTRKRMDEVESPGGGKGNKRSRQRSPSPIEVEDAVTNEKTSVVAALGVLTEKVEQLTHVVAEGFALHRKEQDRIVTALDQIFEVLKDRDEGRVDTLFKIE